MTFDPKSVEVIWDHCVHIPWKYIKVFGYSDLFSKTWTKDHWPLDDLCSGVWEITDKKKRKNSVIWTEKEKVEILTPHFFSFKRNQLERFHDPWEILLFCMDLQLVRWATYLMLICCSWQLIPQFVKAGLNYTIVQDYRPFLKWMIDIPVHFHTPAFPYPFYN